MRISSIFEVIDTTVRCHRISLSEGERQILAFKASLAGDWRAAADVLVDELRGRVQARTAADYPGLSRC